MERGIGELVPCVACRLDAAAQRVAVDVGREGLTEEGHGVGAEPFLEPAGGEARELRAREAAGAVDDDGMCRVAEHDRQRPSVRTVHGQDVHPRHDRPVRIGLHDDRPVGEEPAVAADANGRAAGAQGDGPRPRTGVGHYRGHRAREPRVPGTLRTFGPPRAEHAPWNRERRRMVVRAMDERGRDARTFVDRGASGIGQLEVHADEVEGDDGDSRLPVGEHEGTREQIVVDARVR